MAAVSAKNKQRIGALLLLVASLVFVVRGFRSESGFLWSRDFKPLYAGARCLLHNQDPYDVNALRQQYVQGGGDLEDMQPFQPHYSLYPPPGFFLVTPLALLPWPIAHVVFLVISAALMVTASFLVAWLCLADSPILVPALIGVFLIGGNQLMMLAQPAGPAIGLCVIGVVLLLRQRYKWLAIIAFSLSLALKPHTGALVWLYFFLTRRYRASAVKTAAVTVAICMVAVLWVSFMPASIHWVHELRENLKATELHGALSDPGPLDIEAYWITTLQTVFSVIRDNKAFYNTVSWTLSTALLLMWFAAIRRSPQSRERDMFAIACITCLSMLPIYHRAYDTKLLLLCFPAIAIVLREALERWSLATRHAAEQRNAILWTILAGMLIVLVENDRYSYRLIATMPRPDPAHLVKSILVLRNVPLILMAESLLYLGLLWNTARLHTDRSAALSEPAVQTL